MTDKEKILAYMRSPTVTPERNSMGCSENWYNPFYAICRTFSYEEVVTMSDDEAKHLLRLADAIAEGLF